MATEDPEEISNQLEKVKISTKQIINIIFMGHVDAGKSTICGQILYQLNLIDERTLEKYKKESTEAGRESWYLSWALDTNPEERAKGKTTEVGKASFETKNKKIIILDAPGHKMYVQDMIVGANQADVGILVVSARINEFEAGIKGGQTREHLLLAKASGIKKLIVLVNKMDDPSVKFEIERFNEISKTLNLFLGKLFQISDVKYIPISGFLGINIKENMNQITWYKEESFIDHLDALKFKREEAGLVFSVNEKNKHLGATLFGGKIISGTIVKGMEIVILPSKINTTITAIYDEEDVEILACEVGDNCNLKLKDGNEEIGEGYLFVEPKEQEIKVCNTFTCMLVILETKGLFSLGYKGILHLKNIQTGCEIIGLQSKMGDKFVKRKFVRKNEKILAKIKADVPLCLYGGEEKGKMDWFSIRDEGLTVAIGSVRKVIDMNYN